MMQNCTISKNIEIVPGTYEDYKQLARYHYRDASRLIGGSNQPANAGLGQVTKIYALRYCPVKTTIGVIVYSRPTPGQELRNIATNNFFAGFDQSTQLALLNRNIRRISRVIIEPRFRGLGLATRLVRETMPTENVPIIEAVAVMGLVNPFFEKAGMTAFQGKQKESHVRLIEAFSAIRIISDDMRDDGRMTSDESLDPRQVHRKIEQLSSSDVIASPLGTKQSNSKAEFIETEIRRFLKGYANRRYSKPSLERTAFILSRLTEHPVYYIWFNPKLGYRI